ncbi:MAG: hypothetical protein GC155_09830 [Alphaproteobacteria bacterium]|nr:hypothetical protein [Alphaproteobacteria bacterium]
MTELKLEAVYYSHPFPRSMEALTFMGLVFDRIHLPYVVLPDDGFTLDELVERRDKLVEAIPKHRAGGMGSDPRTMIAALEFTRWKEWTKGFLYYPHSRQDVFDLGDKLPEGLTEEIYYLCFPRKAGWTPHFNTYSAFGIQPVGAKGPGEATILYPGDYTYSAAALTYAGQVGLPIINDVPMLGIPSLPAESLKHNASALASLLAVECMQFILPQIPQLDVSQLMDFRDEMRPYVQQFRIAILKMTKSLSAQIEAGADAGTIAAAARFVIESELQPMLIELKAFAEAPGRPWHRSLIKPLQAWLSPGYWMMPPAAQLARLADGYINQAIASELGTKQREAEVKRSPLYYLLKVQKLGCNGGES